MAKAEPLSSARVRDIKRQVELLAIHLRNYFPNPTSESKPRLHGLADKLYYELEQLEHDLKLMEFDGSIPRK
jgi:hypothetical protein